MEEHRRSTAAHETHGDRHRLWSRRRGPIVAVVLLSIVVTAAFPWRSLFGPNADQHWKSAKEHAARGDWAQAQTIALQAAGSRTPTLSEWQTLADYAFKAGDVDEAEAAWAQIRTANPEHRGALLGLAELYRISGRYHELGPLVKELLKSGDCPSALLFTMAWPDKIWLDQDDRERIDLALAHKPDVTWIALAQVTADALNEEARNHAIHIARQAATTGPAQAEALARWGTLLMESGHWEQLAEWRTLLADRHLTHPQIWYLFGLWQLHHGQEKPAIRCFWETLERAPYHAGATYQLSQLLPRTADREQASTFARQSQMLTELRQAVVFGKGAGGFPDAAVLRKIVTQLVSLSRDREAIGWASLATVRHQELSWPATSISECQARLSQASTDASPSATTRLSQRVRLDHYPLPDWQAKTPLPPSTQAQDQTESVAIRFENVADPRGLQFQYTNGSHISKPAGLMYEISGGGVGVLDYDVDGWPDVYLSEGGPLLSMPRDPLKLDRLYRNGLGAAMQDVSAFALPVELGYGQGVAVGDLNSDGFPDVFVANIGPNQLWINQGDGTFRDATSAAELTGSVWTLSAAIADLNGDGLADIYEVNYLGGEALQRTCNRDGIVVQCRPSMFPAEPDRLWLNEGDGRFRDETVAAGILAHPGKGMGVIAADLDGHGQLSLFVANDMEANALFRNTAARGETPLYVDEALSRGVAVGEEGNPLASMGIAVDDFDQNGFLDFSVTNFQSEASNLYLQDDSGGFLDRSRMYGLYQHSATVMGWGTQSLDADLDGWPDLIVANGHLEDYRRWQILSAMPVQFFHNTQRGQLTLLSENTLGEYFRERHFGRSLARWDGNRDGREDVLVTHVDAPVAWLENQTQLVGHFVAIRLVGTMSERDAIGTRVHVKTRNRILGKQLIAGDGFQVSNQRQCVFGLGDAETIEELRVDWPSGTAQSFTGVPIDREIVLRELSPQWYELAGMKSDSKESIP